MDEDPFADLSTYLQPLFDAEIIRQGRYTFIPVQQLKNAIDEYDNNNSKTYITLVKALREALTYLDKWHIDFRQITDCMDKLAHQQQISPPNWERVMLDPKMSSRFQYKQPISTETFISWLSPDFNHLSPYKQMELIVHKRESEGFSPKLIAHLETHPDFLFKLIMESERNFLRIISTRLSLYLSDQQIATALIEFTQSLSVDIQEPALFIEKVDGLLSNGRSVKTLLRNRESETILVSGSPLFKDYYNEINKVEATEDSELTANPASLKL